MIDHSTEAKKKWERKKDLKREEPTGSVDLDIGVTVLEHVRGNDREFTLDRSLDISSFPGQLGLHDLLLLSLLLKRWTWRRRWCEMKEDRGRTENKENKKEEKEGKETERLTTPSAEVFRKATRLSKLMQSKRSVMWMDDREEENRWIISSQDNLSELVMGEKGNLRRNG